MINNNHSITAKLITPTDGIHASDLIDSVPIPCQHSLFLTPVWQKNWMRSLHRAPQIVIFNYHDKPVGYVLIGERKPVPGLPLTVALLNQTGVEAQDQVWIEFNNIICDSQHRPSCIEALCKLIFSDIRCLRLTISMCDSTSDWLTVCGDNNIAVSQQHHMAYRTHLPDNHDFATFYQQFSSNTRYQVRRAHRETQSKFGDIALTVANVSQQLEFLTELAKFHIIKWGDTEEGSGFTNPAFIAHHQTLITDNPKHCCLLKLQAGNEILGYAYYLLQDNTAYFYCSGVNENIANNKIKPGYLLHLYAMQHFASKGYLLYDFMAGDFRYKQSLSNERYTMTTLTLHNPRAPAKVIEKLRRLFEYIR